MQDLFRRFLNNQCTASEAAMLLAFFNEAKNEEELRASIAQQLEADNENDLQKSVAAIGDSYTIIKQHIENSKIKKLSFYKNLWFRVAAAAILVTGTFAIYKIEFKNTIAQKDIAKTTALATDVKPGGNKALLTLSDGSSIILDSAANGDLTQQGGVKIIKSDNGQLSYNEINGSASEVVYNTISTPRGGQYQLVLADGSKVWLNAASSLRFPASFSGNERKVTLNGEGYFEVAKNAAMPFKIDIAGKGEVAVIGTHFNINSYADEATINTTLLEGSVKVTSILNNNSLFIIPGQQAQLTPAGEIHINKQADINEVMAWKNEKFIFQETDIKTIMRQLTRWYDVEVSFDRNVTDELFVGVISRNVNISQILKMLEKTGTVRFEIQGKKIIVK